MNAADRTGPGLAGVLDRLDKVMQHAEPNGATPPAKRGLPPVPEFPVHALPSALADYCEAGADAIGVPVEMVAAPALVLAGGCIGRSRRLVLKRGYVQRPILWLCVVSPPGTAKTPALDAAMRPCEALQAEAAEKYEAAKKEYEEALSRWTGEERKRQPKPVAPIMAHFFTSDATKEALGAMSQYAPGFTVVRDELVAWVKSFDAYRRGQGGDRQDYLSLWSGTRLKVDRRGGEPLYVPEPTIGVVGGTQPELLPELRGDVGNDGFFDRFLWVYPDVSPAAWSEREVSEEAEKAALDLFRKLRRSWPPDDDGRCLLDTEAREIWGAWFDECMAAVPSASPGAAGVYAKMPNQCARLALVLHCLWHPDNPAGPVSATTLGHAVELAEFFRVHAHRVLAALGTAGVPAAVGLAGRVVRALGRAARERPGGWVQTRRLYQLLGNAVTAEQLNAALTDLLDRGVVERRTVETETKPATEWRLADAPRRANEQYEQSSAAIPDCSYCSFARDGEIGGEEGLL